MKGIGKFVKRAPQMMGSKVGLSQKSNDAVFDDLNRRFGIIEKYSEKLQKDSSSFRDAVKAMLLSGSGFCEHYGTLFRPMGNEIDIERAHPEATNTIVNASYFQQALDELRELLTPEVELIESRILQPVQEFISICKTVRKNITKRDHKLVDYDRHNNAYTKLRDKKEKTLKDEQNLFKVEQDYETAAADYEHYNNLMKEELPRFFEMATRFMTPLFHSFYYMQLNVYYLTLDKLQNFANGKYDISAESVARLEQDYVSQLNDASERLEALTIRKPAMPSARLLQQARSSSGAGSGSPTSTLGSKASLGRSASTTSAAPPPSYSAGGASTAAAAATTKRAPPPIPGKPGVAAKPAIQYVVALYDYAAQAEGDLTFNAGDRIEVVEKTASTEDWWTGRLNGVQGVFPGNYVRDE
ncbi:BAR-domain-containing protein [Meira miltonrushii]|uniref:BAR-domain-containing protein n=1 Tax=Meira miltonrushii TaxID=1280837 RepID=A0A316VA68_9BASI|nr:BAR-domain-containing protein [Meira miltonrushii]PWN32395.1 BAR-domain-containing protein [Meira miltonrushii]